MRQCKIIKLRTSIFLHLVRPSNSVIFHGIPEPMSEKNISTKYYGLKQIMIILNIICKKWNVTLNNLTLRTEKK